MPQRYNGQDRNNDGLADYFTPLNYSGFRLTPDYHPIHPTAWRVDFVAESCPPGGTVQWVVEGQMAAEGCEIQLFLTVSQHLVTVIYDGVYGETESVTPKDWLIAVIGDSYGSGEGNPDVPRRSGRSSAPSRWEDKQCHRSANAGAARAAAQIERADARTSVTLLHLSCSGAQIESGLLGPYAGARPDDRENDKKQAQVAELQRLLGGRIPDALLISIGGNDIGFSEIIQRCLVGLRRCDHRRSKARKRFEAGMRELPGRYARLAEALQPLAVRPSHVIVTGYPDPTRYDDREVCGKERRPQLLTQAPFARGPVAITAREARWASETVLASLNDELRSIARRGGWRFIGTHIAPSRRHGDCATSPWFVTWNEARTRQEAFKKFGFRISPGIVHPNERGHLEYRDALLPALRRLGMPIRRRSE